MKFPVRPELPTASVGSSQAPTAAVDNSAPFVNRPESTYKSGNAVQTSGATSLHCADNLINQTRKLNVYIFRKKSAGIHNAVKQGGGKIGRLALALAAALGSTTAFAAKVDPNDLEHLQKEASLHGAVPVMVGLNSGVSLEVLKSTLSEVRIASEQSANVLLTELGAEAISTGRRNNGLGQIGLYVTAAGLRILQASSNAQTFQFDVTSKMRFRVRDLDGSIDAIEAVMDAKGFAEVEVVLNVEQSDYDIGKDGSTTFRPSAAATTEIASQVTRLLAQPFAKGMQTLEPVSDSPIVKARIDREAFYALRESTLVRAIQPVGFIDPRRFQVTAEMLDRARKDGVVEATMNLRGGLTYSSKSGYMTDKAWNLQGQANKRAFNEILASAGAAKSFDATDNSLALGWISVRLTPSMLEQLATNPDRRILSININKPVAQTQLLNSMSLINMPPAWNAGYRAAGQLIIVMDSGVRKDHVMFQMNGASKVTYEACFGTNVGGYFSICPNADAFGDSPLGWYNSGEPYYGNCNAFPARCAHGTHVAGIAAGRGSSSVPFQGVALDANVVSVQVFSFDPSGVIQPGAFNVDLSKALDAVKNATVPGSNNPYTVNLSLGGVLQNTLGGALSPGNCPNEDTVITSIIDHLYSQGVPVVAATGNNGSKNSMVFPACVPKTIKVSAVTNDSTGTNLSSFSNIADNFYFTGPIILAPGGGNGTDIFSSVIGSSTQIGGISGTSQATPHVAGVYAAIKAAIPGITVEDATMWIKDQGSISIPIGLNGYTANFPRLRIPNF